jgi:hypothetical protein
MSMLCSDFLSDARRYNQIEPPKLTRQLALAKGNFSTAKGCVALQKLHIYLRNRSFCRRFNGFWR